MSVKIINSNTMEWKDAGDSYHTGTKVKVLRDDKDGKTIILKIPKGFVMGEHFHLKNEQHFVLKGQYKIGEDVYTQGTYQLIHAKRTHGPFSSDNGAEILVIWH
ncbi:cupin domain-containing protein [bacterium]|nr:cupin domain-containing protein [candidate division CSSED10-310 bacterium]